MSTDVPKGGLAPCSRRVMNLAHFLRQSAKRHLNEIALVWGERIWTWTQMDARVESMFVCCRLGAVWVPTNFRLTAEEVAYLARASGATAMICGGEFPDHARTAMEQGN